MYRLKCSACRHFSADKSFILQVYALMEVLTTIAASVASGIVPATRALSERRSTFTLNSSTKKRFFSMRPLYLLYPALAGAILGCIADLFLLYEPSAVYEAGDYAFLRSISAERLALGHYLGVLAIPLEGLGLWYLIDGLWQGRERLKTALIWLVSWVLVLGVVYHGSVAWLGAWLRAGGALAEVENLITPLAGALVVGFALLSLLWGWEVWRRSGRYYGRGVLWQHPLLTYLLCIGLYLLVPSVGRYTAVAGFNAALALLFWRLLWEKSPDAQRGSA